MSTATRQLLDRIDAHVQEEQRLTADHVHLMRLEKARQAVKFWMGGAPDSAQLGVGDIAMIVIRAVTYGEDCPQHVMDAICDEWYGANSTSA